MGWKECEQQLQNRSARFKCSNGEDYSREVRVERCVPCVLCQAELDCIRTSHSRDMN